MQSYAPFLGDEEIKDRGLSELEIIRGATIYPAEFLGVEDKYGSIAPGMQANLVILDKNPLDDIGNIESTFMVIMNGRIVFQEVKMKEKMARN